VLESLDAKELLLLSGTGPAEKWTFRSDMVREVAYSTLTKGDRARAHAGIASWMEAHEDTELDNVIDRIAHHYVRSAELTAELSTGEGPTDDVGERALHWLERAATRADQSELPVVGERLYSEGLRLLAGEHGSRHRIFLTGRARALAQQRELGPARVDAQAAVDEARAAGAEGERDLASALLALADIEQKESAWDASEARLAEAGAAFSKVGDARGEAEVQRLRGFGALFRFEYDEATTLLDDALARFESLGDRRGVAWALQNLAWCAFYMGRAEEAEGRLRTAAATFEEIGDKAGLGWAMGLLAWTRFQQGHSLEAEAMAEGVVDDIRNRGDKWALGMMLVLIGSVRLWTGRAVSAQAALEEAQELFTAIDDDFGRGQAGVTLGRALVSSGRLREGFDLLAGLSASVDGAEVAREHFIVTMATAGAAVQVGDTERTTVLFDLTPDGPPTRGDEILVGDVEWVVATGLHALQTGDVASGLSELEDLSARLAPTIDPNVQSALALVRAADGQVELALAAADEVERHDRSSYLDRIIAGMARGFALDRHGDQSASLAAFDQVRAAADSTEDRVSGAITTLADAMAASARGEADAAERSAEADRRLAALGLSDTGWRRAFSLALGISSAA